MSDTEVSMENNDQLLCIVGESTAGKSASLRNIRDQEKWIYLNCEAGKRLPFPNKFNVKNITDPYQVLTYLDMVVQNQDKVAGVAIDTVTFLMEMFESIYITGSTDGRAAWGAYQQFWKTLMQQYVSKLKIPVIMLAHTKSTYNEKKLMNEVSIPIKGALANNGLEAYFTTVVSAKRVPLDTIESYGSEMLNITEDDKEFGYKHVFQTRPTKETTGDRIRSPMGMFSRSETFTDNDAQMMIDRLNKFYQV
ncbi:P-loop NTPase [Alcaligenes phage vB_Af_QDWS595]|uniref:P-loop NTPase n=1 Tax=Alcaligenes phage vB_Af_QDWS595 TaxID=2877946 RepID=A0AAE8Y396_9CAUD|nr:P-loop NTPase [Alcaligenes phage vB_Af_QDWS595]UCR75513.1 P-loop NTPase [Alcaligenes phage vB_Af_QDWS595]